MMFVSDGLSCSLQCVGKMAEDNEIGQARR